MPTNLISIAEYCTHYRVEPTFVESLEETGVIELTDDAGSKFIREEQIAELERYRILHFELHINLEGIDAIRHLLHRQQSLLREIDTLRRQLRLYQ
ncbi:MAG TPA: chaperone modulator CbpM [Flavobacterium sp.]|jgi:hypothetical protein